jgi:short-subunit dehydrogenase
MRAIQSPPVIVITGASSGIGRATAHELARRGAQLVLAARGLDALKTVAAECESLGASSYVVPTDVTKALDVTALAQAALTRFGRIDVWINNVGVGAVGQFDTTPVEAHRRVIESNLIGHIHGAHAALTHFRARRHGILINMISVGGWYSAPYAAAYVASKFGLLGLGESLRAELSGQPDIHVCDVYPAFVDTPGVSHGANYTGRGLKPAPPLVDPRVVASRIAALVNHPRPTTAIGSVAKVARFTRTLAPGMRGRVVRRLMDLALSRSSPVAMSNGNLFDPSRGHAIDGGYRGANSSSPVMALAALSLLGIAWQVMRHVRHRTAPR